MLCAFNNNMYLERQPFLFCEKLFCQKFEALIALGSKEKKITFPEGKKTKILKFY